MLYMSVYIYISIHMCTNIYYIYVYIYVGSVCEGNKIDMYIDG